MVDQKDLRVIISMMVLCNANVVIQYDTRSSGLPSVPLDMEYDNNRNNYSPLNTNISIP